MCPCGSGRTLLYLFTIFVSERLNIWTYCITCVNNIGKLYTYWVTGVQAPTYCRLRFTRLATRLVSSILRSIRPSWRRSIPDINRTSDSIKMTSTAFAISTLLVTLSQWAINLYGNYPEKNLTVWNAFQGRPEQTRRIITKDDITLQHVIWA